MITLSLRLKLVLFEKFNERVPIPEYSEGETKASFTKTNDERFRSWGNGKSVCPSLAVNSDGAISVTSVVGIVSVFSFAVIIDCGMVKPFIELGRIPYVE